MRRLIPYRYFMYPGARALLERPTSSIDVGAEACDRRVHHPTGAPDQLKAV